MRSRGSVSRTERFEGVSGDHVRRVPSSPQSSRKRTPDAAARRRRPRARLHGCTAEALFPVVLRYRVRMDLDYLEEKFGDVWIALSSDPELAHALRPQPLGPGRWAIVMDDSSRARLRDALEDLGWQPDELRARCRRCSRGLGSESLRDPPCFVHPPPGSGRLGRPRGLHGAREAGLGPALGDELRDEPDAGSYRPHLPRSRSRSRARHPRVRRRRVCCGRRREPRVRPDRGRLPRGALRAAHLRGA